MSPCGVLMERYASTVWTLDANFRVYKRHGRQTIPVLMPEELR